MKKIDCLLCFAMLGLMAASCSLKEDIQFLGTYYELTYDGVASRQPAIASPDGSIGHKDLADSVYCFSDSVFSGETTVRVRFINRIPVYQESLDMDYKVQTNPAPGNSVFDVRVWKGVSGADPTTPLEVKSGTLSFRYSRGEYRRAEFDLVVADGITEHRIKGDMHFPIKPVTPWADFVALVENGGETDFRRYY